jgi:hypothetical protein
MKIPDGYHQEGGEEKKKKNKTKQTKAKHFKTRKHPHT